MKKGEPKTFVSQTWSEHGLGAVLDGRLGHAEQQLLGIDAQRLAKLGHRFRSRKSRLSPK